MLTNAPQMNPPVTGWLDGEIGARELRGNFLKRESCYIRSGNFVKMKPSGNYFLRRIDAG
jgi:hypothetical protein